MCIRDRYKDKPEKQQEELLKLQQEYGYKPTAGCMPMPVSYTHLDVYKRQPLR